MNNTKPSGTYRALEIVLGLVALAVGFLALAFPQFVVVTLMVLFGIALLLVGILRLATAYSPHFYGSTRGTNAAIGILAIILALIILLFPTFATVSVVVLIGIGLFIYGIGRIVVGGAATNLPGGLRGLLILVGVLVALFGLIIIFVPAVGILTYAFFVSLAFILIGIDSLASGIVGAPIT
jgi:uncharacterized membrane protein HdeD (DUF308 family)